MRALTILKAVAMAAVASFMLAAGPVRAEWRKAETAHFVVYGDVPERQLRAYAQKAERFDSLLRAYYPITVDHEIPKLEIFLADGDRDMEKAWPGISGSIAGYYSPNSGRIHAVVNTATDIGDVVLFHEYAHHFMFQMKANAYPSWFVEGFAEYYASADVTPGRVRLGRRHEGRMLALGVGSNSWARMEDVLKWRYSPSGRYPAFLYYAQAWGMTHYFLSTPERRAMLGQYPPAVRRGEASGPPVQAGHPRQPCRIPGRHAGTSSASPAWATRGRAGSLSMTVRSSSRTKPPCGSQSAAASGPARADAGDKSLTVGITRCETHFQLLEMQGAFGRRDAQICGQSQLCATSDRCALNHWDDRNRQTLQNKADLSPFRGIGPTIGL